MRTPKILILFLILFSKTTHGQKPCEMKIIHGNLYCTWKPTSGDYFLAKEKVQKALKSLSGFEVKEPIYNLTYIDTIFGKVSAQLAVSHRLDTANPNNSFLMFFYSHTKDTVFAIKPYLFDTTSFKLKKIIAAYNATNRERVSNDEYETVVKEEVDRLIPYDKSLGENSTFYSIQSYRAYSDRIVYKDNGGNSFIFISFYNPTPDYSSGKFDNFLILYSLTDKKLIWTAPMFQVI